MWGQKGEADTGESSKLPVALEEYPTTPDPSTFNRNRKPPPSTLRQTHLKICVIDILKHQSRGLRLQERETVMV